MASTSGVPPPPPAAQVEQQVDALCTYAGRDIGMPQCGHLMQPGGGLQAFADAAAIGVVQREQVQLQRPVMTQVFEQGRGQQPGGMGAEAIGEEADAQRAVLANLHCRKGAHRRRNDRGACARTGQLLGSAGVFAEEGEGLHRTLAGGERVAHLRSQRVHVLPVAQAALPGQALRGDVGFARHQRVRAAIGRCRAFGIIGIFQRMAQPQRDARVLRGQCRGLAEQLRRVGVRAGHPRHAAQPRQRFGVVGAQLQGASCGLLAGSDVAGFQFQVGQHHPGDEVAGLACDRLLQVLPLLPGRHRAQPADSWARASTWCSWLSRCSSGSRSPARMLGRSYNVRPSTRWSVIRPCGKL